jgi:hypothetical protein
MTGLFDIMLRRRSRDFLTIYIAVRILVIHLVWVMVWLLLGWLRGLLRIIVNEFIVGGRVKWKDFLLSIRVRTRASVGFLRDALHDRQHIFHVYV